MSVRALRRGSIAASRVTAPVGTPTTYTIFGSTSDGYVASVTDNLDAGGGAVTNADIYVGQRLSSLNAFEGFLAFDTSSIPDEAAITSVTLSVCGFSGGDSSTTDFVLEARLSHWGPSLVEDDFRTRAQLNSLPLLASLSTSTWSTAGYNTLVSEAAFLDAINTTGITRFLLCSSRHRESVSPTGTEFVGFRSGDASGTSEDPKLVVEALVTDEAAGAAAGTVSVTGPTGSNVWSQSNLAVQIKTTATNTFKSLTFKAQASAARAGGYVGIASAQPTSSVAWLGKAQLSSFHEGAGEYTVELDSPVTMTSGVDYYLVFLGTADQIRFFNAAESKTLTGLTKDSTETHYYGTNFGSTFDTTDYPYVALST